MLIILSTPEIREQLESKIGQVLQIKTWITIETIPTNSSEILNLLDHFGCRNTESEPLLFLLDYDQYKPADFPGLFLQNRLLSFVFYRDKRDLENWLQSLRMHQLAKPKKALLLAMMKPFYELWATKFHTSLQKTQQFTQDAHLHLPENTSSDDLAEILSEGCALAIYVGHGRSRGWSAYRGFRWKHLETKKQQNPVGILISLSCDALKKDKVNSMPFGLQWVSEARACTTFSSCEALQIKPLETIAQFLISGFSNPKIRRIDELLVAIHEQLLLKNDPVEIANWQQFRLIGNPMQAIYYPKQAKKMTQKHDSTYQNLLYLDR